MASMSLGTLVKTPRRSRLSVSSLNHRSMRFTQELDVGVKCRCQRLRSRWLSHLVISGALWADRLSRTTWTARPLGTEASICLKKASTCLLYTSDAADE